MQRVGHRLLGKPILLLRDDVRSSDDANASPVIEVTLSVSVVGAEMAGPRGTPTRRREIPAVRQDAFSPDHGEVAEIADEADRDDFNGQQLPNANFKRLNLSTSGTGTPRRARKRRKSRIGRRRRSTLNRSPLSQDASAKAKEDVEKTEQGDEQRNPHQPAAPQASESRASSRTCPRSTSTSSRTPSAKTRPCWRASARRRYCVRSERRQPSTASSKR